MTLRSSTGRRLHPSHLDRNDPRTATDCTANAAAARTVTAAELEVFGVQP